MISAAGEYVVTDHALIRWLERAKGIDMEWMRQQLWNEVRDAALAGATRHVTPDCTYVFTGGRLVTVLAPEMLTERRHSRRRKPRDFREIAAPAAEVAE